MKDGVRLPSRRDGQARLLELAVERVHVAAAERSQAQVTERGEDAKTDNRAVLREGERPHRRLDRG